MLRSNFFYCVRERTLNMRSIRGPAQHWRLMGHGTAELGAHSPAELGKIHKSLHCCCLKRYFRMRVGSTVRQEGGGLDAWKTCLSVSVPPPTSYSDLTKSPRPCTDPWTSCPPHGHKWAPLPLWLPGQPVQVGTKMQAVTWRWSPQKLRAWGPGLAWPLHVHSPLHDMQESVGAQSPNPGCLLALKRAT